MGGQEAGAVQRGQVGQPLPFGGWGVEVKMNNNEKSKKLFCITLYHSKSFWFSATNKGTNPHGRVERSRTGQVAGKAVAVMKCFSKQSKGIRLRIRAFSNSKILRRGSMLDFVCPNSLPLALMSKSSTGPAPSILNQFPWRETYQQF